MERARLTGGSQRQRVVLAGSRCQVGGHCHRPTPAGIRLNTSVLHTYAASYKHADWPYIHMENDFSFDEKKENPVICETHRF